MSPNTDNTYFIVRIRKEKEGTKSESLTERPFTTQMVTTSGKAFENGLLSKKKQNLTQRQPA